MEKKMQIQTKKILVNGVGINYIEQGKGDPVVFVHGSLGDFRAWVFQMWPFSMFYHVVAYSRRYHYPNAWVGDGSDYSATLHAEDLAALIKALRLGSVHVVALSYGAYVALLLAVKHPEMVRTLVLGEPSLIPWLKHIPEGDSLLAEFLTSITEPSKCAFLCGDMEQGVKIFINGILGMDVFDQLPQFIRGSIMNNALELKAELSAPNLFPTFTCEDARKIKMPTLLLTGELRPNMFHLITDELERCMVNKERAIILGASHTMHAGNPLAYNKTVLAFLAKH
jgi:pimeloyl-ACP methyl ester carboxylesterase